MHFRPFRSLSAAAVSSFLLLGLVSSASAAGEKDKEALKLHEQAINEDYLNADFPKAIGKLKDALKKCGTDGCTPAVVAKLHVSLGTIYGLGNGKLDQAKDEFILGLKADPAVTVDSALTNPDLDKAFAEAKKAAGGGAAPAGTGGTTGGGKKPPAADGEAGTHKAPPEQVVNTPVPIYMEPSEEQPASKVTLRYKPFGSKTYTSVELKKMGTGFGGEIPCKDVTTTGDIKYFFALTDEAGEAAGTLGTTKDPYKVTIKNEIDGEAPTLPGQKAPDQCKDISGSCPPDFPGCKDALVAPKERGAGASCDETLLCSEPFVCTKGTCEDVGGAKSKKRNLVSLGLQLDWLIVGSRNDVCSAGASDSYACFLTGTSHQFDGIPGSASTKSGTSGGTNGVVGGGSFGDVRLLVGYDRQLFASLPLTLGVRLGWAFGGSPTPDNVLDKDGTLKNSTQSPALGFHPFHGEARATYHFLGFFEKKKIRPYAFVGGGIAQVNASVPIKVCDLEGTNATACKSGVGKVVDVDAYQITGLGFIGLGVGATYGITPSFGVSAEVKMMIMVPTSGFVVSPNFGPVLAF